MRRWEVLSMNQSERDAVDRLLEEALGPAAPAGADVDVDSMEEALALIQAEGIQWPVTPRPEDYSRLPEVEHDATEEDAAEAYRHAQAAAVLRIAREVKRRRLRESE
jgi:hypothetical protein